jgi:acetyltransferase-like isoleucine patch superfamily enzyme
MASSHSLNRFLGVRHRIAKVRIGWLRLRGIDLPDEVNLSLSAKLVPAAPGAISIGNQTSIGPLASLCAYRPDGSVSRITIGNRCFIGGNAVIGPGVSIGDGVIVAAGAIVLRSVPAGCIVAGNPARVVREGIKAGRFGRLPRGDRSRYGYELDEVIKSLLRQTRR